MTSMVHNASHHRNIVRISHIGANQSKWKAAENRTMDSRHPHRAYPLGTLRTQNGKAFPRPCGIGGHSPRTDWEGDWSGSCTCGKGNPIQAPWQVPCRHDAMPFLPELESVLCHATAFHKKKRVHEFPYKIPTCTSFRVCTETSIRFLTHFRVRWGWWTRTDYETRRYF